MNQEALPADWEPWFVNVNDGTSEGIRARTCPSFSVQFHPEASPGPEDTAFLFDDFMRLVGAMARVTVYGAYLPRKPRKVLVLGSGALQIGQAGGSFDYSGTQAIKALKEEGIATVLINPNIATIQTSEGMADKLHLTAVTPSSWSESWSRRRCALLSFGGQTALNCGLALDEAGVLHKYGVRVLGTPVKTIRDTEDRKLFIDGQEIGVVTARSRACRTADEVRAAARQIGFPVMLRGASPWAGRVVASWRPRPTSIRRCAASSPTACPRCWSRRPAGLERDRIRGGAGRARQLRRRL